MRQLRELAKAQEDFEKLGFQLVAISYDEVETLKAFTEKEAEKKKVYYPLLADPKSDVIKAFGILNEKIRKDHDWYGVPYPHIFLVNPKGRIDGKFFESRYQDRPTVDSILAFIIKMQKKSMEETSKSVPDG
ncbi:redoxin domain-containing protein [Candidatus Latescibacterota bacterium]